MNARIKELEENPKDTTFKFSQRFCNIALPLNIAPLIDTNDEPTVESMMSHFVFPVSSKDLTLESSKEIKTLSIPSTKEESEEEEEDEEITIIQKGDVIEKTIRRTKPKTKFNKKVQVKNFVPEKITYKFDTATFLKDAPKIQDLINHINKFPNLRHVIYTRYNRHFGVKMLLILFKYLGYTVYGSHAEMEHEDHNDIIEAFNENLNPAIYITSGTYLHGYDLYNVSHLHLLDSNTHVVNALLQRIFKYRLYQNIPCNLEMHSYICKHQELLNNINSRSADEITFDYFLESQKAEISLWDPLTKKGTPLYLDQEGYIVY
jgi:hypothetical protein